MQNWPVAGQDKPPSRLRQGREGHRKTSCAGVRWRPDEHERSELPRARIDSPGTGRKELEALDFFPHGCLGEVIVFDQ